MGVVAPTPEADSVELPNPVATDPGMVCTSCEKIRPFNGRLLTWRVSRSFPIEEVVLSTNGAVDCTSTVVAVSPTCIRKSTRLVPLTTSTLPSDTASRNPGAFTLTWYVPGGRLAA